MQQIDSDLPALLTTMQAAACLNVSPKTMAYWRATGDGPAFTRLGIRSIRYRRDDLLAYVAGCRRLNHVGSVPAR